MSDTFLNRFMRLALDVTGAERGMVVDSDLNVVSAVDLPDNVIQTDDFSGFENIRQAYRTGERPHITNNVILEDDAAPTTNTNFANLRLVVVFPLDEMGAVYIDKHITQGVIDKTDAERLMRLAEHLIEQGQLELTQEAMSERYASV